MKRFGRISAFIIILLVTAGMCVYVGASDLEEYHDEPDAPALESRMLLTDKFPNYVRIALIDTGISNENGLLDEERILPGKNYVLPDDGTNDKIGHGTYIASIIIGAKSEEAVILEEAENVLLVPLVYYSENASGGVQNGLIPIICEAIRDAVDEYGCKVINISSGVLADDKQMRSAIKYAEDMGVVVVSAVGNSNKDAAGNYFYPAGYDTVIGVGAVDNEGKVADFSQRNESVYVTAPGVDILAASAVSGENFIRVSGTSYSTAYVSALAGQLMYEYPELTPSQFRHILAKTSKKPSGSEYTVDYGYGILDVDGARKYCAELIKNPVSAFSDVSEGEWYFGAVAEAVKDGYMDGVSMTKFEPEGRLTRAMTAAVLFRKNAKPSYFASVSPFYDVGASAWYADAVSWAYESGIINGYGDGRYRPDGYITREQLCVMLYREAGGFASKQYNELTFSDASNISSYAYDAVKWAVGEGIINGTDENKMMPKDYVTRAQCAAMLTRGR